MLGKATAVTTIRCGDLQKQRTFYGETLGLREVERDERHVMFEAGGGTRLLLYPGERAKADHTLLSFDVQGLEKVIQGLEQRGVRFEDYDMPGLKTGKDHIATMGDTRCAWFRDPEGNYLGVTEMKK